MKSMATIFVLIVTALHVWFLILEMFLWTKPIGLKIIGQSREKANVTAVLADNQGLYNGFLAAGLLLSFILSDVGTALTFRVFFLSCVIVAGVYGAATAHKKIFFMQALPALIALALMLISSP